MSRRLITPDEFAKARAAGELELETAALYRYATSAAEFDDADVDDASRTISYRFSGGDVARDLHTINQQGWKLDNFLLNPVFLWAHDSVQLPIGKVIDIGVLQGWLRGKVEYPTRDIYPFADTVFQMVKKRFLNAVSTSWLPIEWKFSTDKSRPGGIDFLKQELLEVSQVPLPAQPSALAEARAAGIDTAPFFEWAGQMLDQGGFAYVPRIELENLRKAAKMPTPRKRSDKADWKVGAARDLPAGKDGEWDGPAASKRLLADAGFEGDSPDAEKARRGFLVYDAANPTLKGSYKFPFADIVDGKLQAMPAGIKACASRLPDSDLSQSVKDEADEVVKAYEKKMGIGDDNKQAFAVPFARDLMDVGDLANVIGWLAWIQQGSKWEAEQEGDGSLIPSRLADAVAELGLILVDMTKEEVDELVSLLKAQGEDVETTSQSMSKSQQVLYRLSQSARFTRSGAPKVVFRNAVNDALVVLESRSGKKISRANADKLSQAMEHHRAMGECIQSVLEQAEKEDDDGGAVDNNAAKEQRFREVEIAAARLSILT